LGQFSDRQTARLEKAALFLQTSQLALTGGDHESCVSRAYYAVFNCMVALTPSVENEATGRTDSHDKVIDSCSKWDRSHGNKLITVGLLSDTANLLNSLQELKSLRENADYRVKLATRDTCVEALGFAIRFVDKVKEIQNDWAP